MRARTGSVRIWHWAHVAHTPGCAVAREAEWHLAWKAEGLDGTQERVVGRRRADVLAPGGYAVEFQASPIDQAEIRGREHDWSAQGGMVWVFRADQATIRAAAFFSPGEKYLLKKENQDTLTITWPHAPERVRAARAPSFLDLGDGELLFVGGWRLGSSPLTGHGWRVPKGWVVQNVLRGNTIPAPLTPDPWEIKAKILAWQEKLENQVPRQRGASASQSADIEAYLAMCRAGAAVRAQWAVRGWKAASERQA